MASHQLKPQLGAAIGMADLINEELPKKNKDIQEYYETLQESLQRTTTIVTNMLNSQVLNADGDISLNIKPANINRLIRSEIKNAQHSASEKNITINYTNTLKRNINIDSAKIQEVLTNLISNAITYSDKDSVVNINATQTTKRTSIEIADTGIGIPKKDITKITKQFYRSENAKKTRPTGTGIGMFLADRFIRAHNGELTITSKLHKGTSICITLPNNLGLTQ